jgi:hypothetical protein
LAHETAVTRRAVYCTRTPDKEFAQSSASCRAARLHAAQSDRLRRLQPERSSRSTSRLVASARTSSINHSARSVSLSRSQVQRLDRPGQWSQPTSAGRTPQSWARPHRSASRACADPGLDHALCTGTSYSRDDPSAPARWGAQQLRRADRGSTRQPSREISSFAAGRCRRDALMTSRVQDIVKPVWRRRFLDDPFEQHLLRRRGAIVHR